VKRLLVNPLYSGILVNHKYEIEDFLTGRQVSLPEQERFYHRQPGGACPGGAAQIGRGGLKDGVLYAFYSTPLFRSS
jgi:hypothetical protein